MFGPARLSFLWSKMSMFQKLEIRDAGLPLPPAFQYLILMIWRDCDLNLVKYHIFTVFKMPRAKTFVRLDVNVETLAENYVFRFSVMIITFWIIWHIWAPYLAWKKKMQIADCQGFVQINFHSTCVLSHWSIPTGLGGLGSFFSCCSTNNFLRMLMHVKYNSTLVMSPSQAGSSQGSSWTIFNSVQLVTISIQLWFNCGEESYFLISEAVQCTKLCATCTV